MRFIELENIIIDLDKIFMVIRSDYIADNAPGAQSDFYVDRFSIGFYLDRDAPNFSVTIGKDVADKLTSTRSQSEYYKDTHYVTYDNRNKRDEDYARIKNLLAVQA